MNADDISALITDSGCWRREWRTHDPEALLAALTTLGTPLALTRAAFILAHLGRFDEAAGLLTDPGCPLTVGTRAALTLNRAAAEQDMALIDALCDADEFAGSGEYAVEGQLLLDLARGQAWLERGDTHRAGELLRSALRLSRMIEAPTAFIESQLARLIRDPMTQVRELEGHLDRAVRAGDLRTIGAVAADLGYAALNCLNLTALARATRYMLRGPLRDEYLKAAGYLRGDRASPVPRGSHPTLRLLGHLAALETALVARWGFEHTRWPELAERLVALSDPTDPEATLHLHATHLIRARAWIILSDGDSAQRELAYESRYRRLSLLGALTGLEGALLLGQTGVREWLSRVEAHAGVLPPDMLRWLIQFAARLCPVAVAFCADAWGGPWEDVRRARVYVITRSLHDSGMRALPSAEDRERIASLRAYLAAHPGRGLAPNFALHDHSPHKRLR